MSQDINVGFLSETINNKADIDLRNIDTNKCDMVIEYQEPTEENNYTWYRLYASGWVEQGGIITSGTAGVSVVLPVVMENNKYTITYSQGGDDNNYDSGTDVIPTSSLSVTGFIVNRYVAGVISHWQVSGLADMTHHEILPTPTSRLAKDLVIQVLEEMYPVGSLYMGTQATCPMSVFFGTWELVSNGKALWTGDGTNANTTIAAGLPNIKGTFAGYELGRSGKIDTTGAFYEGSASSRDGTSTSNGKAPTIGFNASRSNSIYSDSVSTVQPPAYVVNVWRRTA